MRQLRAFFEEEDAIGVVEIILILVVKCTTSYRMCIQCKK